MSGKNPSGTLSRRKLLAMIESAQARMCALQSLLDTSPIHQKKFGEKRRSELAHLQKWISDVARAYRERSISLDKADTILRKLLPGVDFLIQDGFGVPATVPPNHGADTRPQPEKATPGSERDPLYVIILKSLSLLYSRPNREQIELTLRDLKLDVREMRAGGRSKWFIRSIVYWHVTSTVLAFATDKLLRWSEQIRKLRNIAGSK